MACPHFMPVARFQEGFWIVPPRLPLNDTFRGVCRASSEEFEPPERSQRELCNCGYARGRCERFPNESADAVRFSVTAEKDGVLRVVWVMEHDHSPGDHGVLEYSIAESRVLGDIGEVLLAQLRAFLQNYLNRTMSARG